MICSDNVFENESLGAMNPILLELLDQLQPIDFKERVFPKYKKLKKELSAMRAALVIDPNDDEMRAGIDTIENELRQFKLLNKHYLIVTIEEIIGKALELNMGLCRMHDFIYLYNGFYWELLGTDVLKGFLGNAAIRLGVNRFDAKYFQFKADLMRQFLVDAYLPEPAQNQKEVLINLKNGTYFISSDKNGLREFNRSDFLMYQLPFEYNPDAKADLFQQYLDDVLPEKECQMILAEFLGYLFVPKMKLEKALLLHGSGANGKSVFFEIVNALLGKENITMYSLQNLTNPNGYYRAKIVNRLLNYASEINGKLETSVFKQLVSNEPVEARLPYGQPFQMTNYGRFIFNCNELPQQVEFTNAYFRRFLIIPFEVTIPAEKQDKDLAKKIIEAELSGVFNWVLSGLERLTIQNGFTRSDKVDEQVDLYRKGVDNVNQFITDEGLIPSVEEWIKLKELYVEYSRYCVDFGFRSLNKRNFRERLEHLNIKVNRINKGNVVYATKKQAVYELPEVTSQIIVLKANNSTFFDH